MPKQTKSKITYAKLGSLATKTIPEAKLQVSLNVLVPKELERKAEKWMNEAHEELSDAFKKFIKKEQKKAEAENED